MEHKYFIILILLVVLISLCNTPLSHGMDTISISKYITQGTTIVSSGGKFELGFFTPGKTSNYYIGIWYKNIVPQTVVWVANRNTPIPSREINSSKLIILEGNLVLMDGAQNLVWSTNISSNTMSKNRPVVVTLRNDGNLVLSEDDKYGTLVWQSFEHPTDTLLSGEHFAYNKRTKAKTVFTSWKSADDPSPGLYALDRDAIEAFQIWNGTEKYWNTGPFNGTTFQNDHHELKSPMRNSTIVDNENETYFFYYIPSIISRHIIDTNGQQKHLAWMDTSKEWQVFYSQPTRQCDVYAYCGPFSICNQNSPSNICDCLQGFKQRSDNDFTSGCLRKSNLQCGKNSIGEEDKFAKYTNVRLPRHPRNVTVANVGECGRTCLSNCSCTAYAYNGGHGCSFWVGELFNLEQQDAKGGNTIYVRLAASEFSKVKDDKNSKGLSGKLKAIVLSAIVVVLIVLACILAYVCYHKRKRTLKKEGGNENDGIGAMDLMIGEHDDDEGINVQFFSFKTILAATENFSDSNKLGKGGFGLVYKGKFLGGQEVAVKRLWSHRSEQGLNEFKNEVILIAKLQHRNLVKLQGYCIHAKEKILIYEYMPNKSLDTFIFDQVRRTLLDWNMRLDIILGIARALIYLHHDSRLRIIHRDLKTQNILLDEDMMPKVADFGLARLVEGKTQEVNTNKIAGTYGYMSPEYALHGMFSIKSDVFSFGVVMLEIITGKNNTSFYEHEEVSNLLGYVWNLWSKGNAMELVDESILQSNCNENEVLKVINIGLLCVEEDPNNRPSMPDVLIMLGNESTTLPKPSQPAFVTRAHTPINFNVVEFDKPCSNELTITDQVGR